jgi:hypothetical protein
MWNPSFRCLSPILARRHLLCSSVLCLALLSCACKGGDSTTAQPEPQEEPQVLMTSTDESGAAEVRNADGDTVLHLEAIDENGDPLPEVDVLYLGGSPYPLVAFNQSESGDPAGTFELVPGSDQLSKTAGEGGQIDSGVFVLNYLDPTLSRLYDPGKDSYQPVEYPNIGELRQIVDLNALRMYLLTVPGLEDDGEITTASLRDVFEPGYRAHMMEEVFHGVCPAERCPIAHRVARIFEYCENQHRSFRYQRYVTDQEVKWFWLPLGVAAGVTIDSPVDGATITGEDDRDVEIAGSINLPPDVVTADGGHVELWINGVHYADALGVGGDGTGDGSLFSSSALVHLAEGQNTIRLVACVSEVNRGLENGPEGEAGEATVSVTYQGGDSGLTAPSLTQLTHPSSFPCPEGTVPLTFHFSDPDGDVVTAYEHMSWSFRGQPGDQLRSGDVSAQEKFECLRGTEGDCSFELTYQGFEGGDWFRWEFWVEDAGGLVSQKLTMTANVTGDCFPLDTSQAAAPQVVVQRLP